MTSLGAAGDGIFDFQDLSGNFSVGDIFLTSMTSLVLGMLIAYVYRATHKGVSYSQSFVQTLVILSMVVSVVMLIIGSNLARAFSLVGALSVVRFRNAVKETRDVGFVFFVMIIGMAAGTRFYVLAAVAATTICLVILIMVKFNLFALLERQSDPEDPGGERRPRRRDVRRPLPPVHEGVRPHQHRHGAFRHPDRAHLQRGHEA